VNTSAVYWLALSMIDNLGPVTARRLLNIFGNPETIFKASFTDLKSIEGIGEKRAKAIKEFKGWSKAEGIIKKCNALNIKFITQEENFYPENLRTIPDAPLVIFVMGEPVSRDRYAIAIVGSRKSTDYGRRAADKLSRDLSQLGITIVSGLARGIDTVAHSGSLKTGGRTIGVFASGLNRPYPPENKTLIKKILENRGYVVSEFPPDMPPNKENFPKRNRLISGLSLGVIVVEAGLESGALITANYALEQGREVFAVPGSIFSKNAEGTNNLIKKGARLVSGVDDILEELAPKLKGLITNKSRQPRALELSDREKDIINILGDEIMHIDEIARKAGRPVYEISSILLELELKGVVRQEQGKRFYII
jgi:DNA processing protein